MANLDLMHWKQLTDEQVVDIIHKRGRQLTGEMVTTQFIAGMRCYRDMYPEFPHEVLAFMVNIDIEDGFFFEPCGHFHH